MCQEDGSRYQIFLSNKKLSSPSSARTGPPSSRGLALAIAGNRAKQIKGLQSWPLSLRTRSVPVHFHVINYPPEVGGGGSVTPCTPIPCDAASQLLWRPFQRRSSDPTPPPTPKRRSRTETYNRHPLPVKPKCSH